MHIVGLNVVPLTCLRQVDHAWVKGCAHCNLRKLGQIIGDLVGWRYFIFRMVAMWCRFLTCSILGHLCQRMYGMGLIIVTLMELLCLMLQILVGRTSGNVFTSTDWCINKINKPLQGLVREQLQKSLSLTVNIWKDSHGNLIFIYSANQSSAIQYKAFLARENDSTLKIIHPHPPASKLCCMKKLQFRFVVCISTTLWMHITIVLIYFDFHNRLGEMKCFY